MGVLTLARFTVRDRPSLPYDALSYWSGSRSNRISIPALSELRMVKPVVRAPIKYLSVPAGQPKVHIVVDGYRQKPPFNLNLPVTSYFGTTLYQTHSYYMAANVAIGSTGNIPDSVKNKAYDKLVDKMRSSASIGAALAEASDSYAMVANRAKQLLDFGRAVKKLQFSKAADILRQSTIPKGVSKKKSFASNYLEYHFGWSPMIGDIYDAIDVLQSPMENFSPRGKASTGSMQYFSQRSPPADYSSRTTGVWSGHVHAGVDVRIVNPNLWLANQLGLVNPASVAWEVVPFSFVVDWFVNVEQTLSSFTDFLGLETSNPFTTLMFKQKAATTWGKPYFWRSGNSYIEFTRSLTLLKPVLARKNYKADNLRRALSQVALLNNLFLEGRSRSR